MRTIVVGYDATPPAERALDRGLELAAALGAQLVVVSVAPLVAAGGRGGPGDPTDSVQMHREQLQQAQERLAGHGVACSFTEGVGEPSTVILDVAEEHDADLIVVGTRELSLVGRLLGQSVSAAVSRHADRDVMIVHDR